MGLTGGKSAEFSAKITCWVSRSTGSWPPALGWLGARLALGASVTKHTRVWGVVKAKVGVSKHLLFKGREGLGLGSHTIISRGDSDEIAR